MTTIAAADATQNRQRPGRINRREQIIRESAVLFEKVGYHGASMQLVAEAVGLGKPTLYHYFRSKTEILHAMHQDLIKELFDKHAEREAKDLSVEELLLGVATDILKQIDEHPGYVRAFFEHHDELDPDQQKEMRKQRGRYMDIVCELIARGKREGRFVDMDPTQCALAFLGMCNFSYKWFPGRKNRDVQATAETMSRIFLDGLRKR